MTVEGISSGAKQRIIDLEEMKQLSLKNHGMILQHLGEYRHFASYQKFLIAPICHIPNELLSEIFIMCIADSNFKTPFSFSGLPWLLGKVCPLWCDIMLNTPFLWNRIPQISVQSDSLGTNHALVQMSMELAREPLSINIDIDTTLYDVSTPLLDTLLSHSDQISELEVNCHWGSLCLLSGLHAKLPNLQTLKLTTTNSNHDLNTTIFSIALQLRDVCFLSNSRLRDGASSKR